MSMMSTCQISRSVAWASIAHGQLTTASSSSIIPSVFLDVFDSFTMQFNRFGIVYAYHHHTSHNPDFLLSVNKLSQTCESIPPNSVEEKYGNYSSPWPWSNMSIWYLMMWKYTGSAQKSNAKVSWVVCEVLQAPDFNIQDLWRFNASTKTSQFDAV